MFRSSDEIRENVFGDVITREAGLDHAGPIVDHDRLRGEESFLLHQQKEDIGQKALILNRQREGGNKGGKAVERGT